MRELGLGNNWTDIDSDWYDTQCNVFGSIIPILGIIKSWLLTLPYDPWHQLTLRMECSLLWTDTDQLNELWYYMCLRSVFSQYAVSLLPCSDTHKRGTTQYVLATAISQLKHLKYNVVLSSIWSQSTVKSVCAVQSLLLVCLHIRQMYQVLYWILYNKIDFWDYIFHTFSYWYTVLVKLGS